MAIICTPSSIAQGARCFCAPDDLQQAETTYLLAVLAGGTLSPAALFAASNKWQGVDDGLLIPCQIYALALLAGASTNPKTLAAAAACYCLPDDGYAAATNYLLATATGSTYTPTSLALAARTFAFDEGTQIGIQTYLLASMAGFGNVPGPVLAVAKQYLGLSDLMMQQILVYLTCQWAKKKLSANLGVVWVDQPLANWNLFNGGTASAFGNGMFVVTGLGPYWSSYSKDGLNWINDISVAMANAQWISMVFDGSKFVVMGSVAGGSGITQISYDGIHWPSGGTLPGGIVIWKQLAYINGMFIAVGNNNIAYSNDGINWSAATVPTNLYSGVDYGNGVFVAVGYNVVNKLTVLISSDGINWSTTPCPAGKWIRVVYGKGLFVAIEGTNSGKTMYSPDGINWTLATGAPDFSAGLPLNLPSICYGGGVFVVGAGLGNNSTIATSNDGITWTQRVNKSTPPDAVCTISYGLGFFVACRNTSGYFTSGL